MDRTSEPDWAKWLPQLNAACAEDDARTRLERARAFIEANYATPIDLDRLARQACYSRFHFLRQFRREFDITPHQYLTRTRIARAKDLLEATELPVTEVCFEVGFHSLGSFSTLFQRHVGHSPNRYRARMVQCLGMPSVLTANAIPACFLAAFGVPSAA